MIVAACSVVSIAALSLLNLADVLPHLSYVVMGGVFAGAGALIWSAHALLAGGGDEFPHIVVDRFGIHFKSLQGEDRDSIVWPRINSVESDETALILFFEPEDIASDDPKKRISTIRIAVDEKRRIGLPAAIEHFRAIAGRQP